MREVEKRFKKYKVTDIPEIGSKIDTATFDMSEIYRDCEVVEIIKEIHKYTEEEETFAVLYHPDWNVIEEGRIPNTFNVGYCMMDCNKECYANKKLEYRKHGKEHK